MLLAHKRPRCSVGCSGCVGSWIQNYTNILICLSSTPYFHWTLNSQVTAKQASLSRFFCTKWKSCAANSSWLRALLCLDFFKPLRRASRDALLWLPRQTTCLKFFWCWLLWVNKIFLYLYEGYSMSCKWLWAVNICKQLFCTALQVI